MQYGFYIDQRRCMNCFACVVACKDWHDIPPGPAAWIRVETIEKGKYPEPVVAFLPVACYHCEQPACIPVCPANAITKRKEDGIVVVDRDACLGKDKCGLCLEACLYGVPQFGAEADATMQKCDLCLERWAEGKKPVCVSSCPMYALDAGPMDELIKKYGKGKEAVGFTYSAALSPAVIYQAKHQSGR